MHFKVRLLVSLIIAIFIIVPVFYINLISLMTKIFYKTQIEAPQQQNVVINANTLRKPNRFGRKFLFGKLNKNI